MACCHPTRNLGADMGWPMAIECHRSSVADGHRHHRFYYILVIDFDRFYDSIIWWLLWCFDFSHWTWEFPLLCLTRVLENQSNVTYRNQLNPLKKKLPWGDGPRMSQETKPKPPLDESEVIRGPNSNWVYHLNFTAAMGRVAPRILARPFPCCSFFFWVFSTAMNGVRMWGGSPYSDFCNTNGFGLDWLLFSNLAVYYGSIWILDYNGLYIICIYYKHHTHIYIYTYCIYTYYIRVYIYSYFRADAHRRLRRIAWLSMSLQGGLESCWMRTCCFRNIFLIFPYVFLNIFMDV